MTFQPGVRQAHQIALPGPIPVHQDVVRAQDDGSHDQGAHHQHDQKRRDKSDPLFTQSGLFFFLLMDLTLPQSVHRRAPLM